MSHDINKIVDSVVKEIMSAPVTDRKSLKNKEICRKMTLNIAKSIVEAVKQKAKSMGVNAVVAVSNEAGHPVAVECMDDAYIASYDIAVNKAFTCASLKMSTATLAELAAPGGSLYGIQYTNGSRIVIFGGGEPLKCEGRVVGAVGVSGGSAEQDTELGAFAARYFADNYT